MNAKAYFAFLVFLVVDAQPCPNKFLPCKVTKNSWPIDFRKNSNSLRSIDTLTAESIMKALNNGTRANITRNSFEFLERFDAHYKFFAEPLPADKAARLCGFLGSSLFVPSSREELVAVMDLNDIGYIWINMVSGYIDDSNLIYHTIDGRPATDFYMDQMNIRVMNNEMKCVYTSKYDYKSQKKYCFGNPLPFVCKRIAQQTKNLLQKSTKFCGTNDLDYIYEESLGSCYKYQHESMTWSSATAKCNSEGSHITVLNSYEEAKYVSRLSKHWVFPSNYQWTGLVDPFGTGFMTPDGVDIEATGFDRWLSGQPDNLKGNERCCQLEVDEIKLDDRPCMEQAPFVCEKEAILIRQYDEELDIEVLTDGEEDQLELMIENLIQGRKANPRNSAVYDNYAKAIRNYRNKHMKKTVNH